MSKERIVKKLQERHKDSSYVYTCCTQNGCWDSNCILRCQVKDGKIVSIEPDNSINPGNAREDVGEEAFNQGMIQMRPCSMGHAWKKELDSPTRILHPMKRVGKKGHGNGHFVQITWEEALDTITKKIVEFKEKYGPYSIFHSQYCSFEKCGIPIAPWFDAGFACWGEHSTSGHNPGEKYHLGFDIIKSLAKGESDLMVGFEAPDLFNSKLIVLWAMDPVVAWFGSVSYYMKLARERGAKVIVIDPRYTASAEVLADQWIPIRPGTDLAMMLAIAYVLYDENIYDHEYVDKYVEPKGFEKFRAYVMGEEDGQPKTPQWAEEITTVPAETIYAFAKLYAESKPVHLQYFYAGAKRHLGEYSATAAMLLQAMTGNLSIAGGCQTGCSLVTPPRIPVPRVDWQMAPPEYKPPILFNNNKLTETIICREKFDNGEITEEEFRSRIGSPPGAPLPNIKMIIFENNYVNNHHHTNKRMQAFSKMEFSWGFQWHINQPSAQFMDIVLPAPVYAFETMDKFMYGNERFIAGPSGMRNYFFYCGKAVDPPGEVRPKDWVWTEIARRLGIVEKFNPRMANVPLEKWDDELVKLYKEAYEIWAQDEDGWLEMLEIEPKPWEEFLKCPVVRIPIDEPFYPYKNKVEAGENPFGETPTGKIEFSSTYFENTDLTQTHFRGHFDSIPRWEPTYMTEPANDSFYHPKTAKYPLSLVTPVSTYRQHSSNDNNPLLRDDCYRHAVWIGAVDAEQRGIKDGDQVRVFNEFGEMIIPAYVTSRCMPGTVAVHHGAWYTPNEEKTELNPFGVDMRGACNLLIGDTHLPHALGALLTAGLVEVEKLGGDN